MKLKTLNEAVKRNNFDMSPAIKKYLRAAGYSVKTKSAWSGRMSNGIVILPPEDDQYSKTVKKLIPLLLNFAREQNVDAEVYLSDWNDRLVFEYAPTA